MSKGKASNTTNSSGYKYGEATYIKNRERRLARHVKAFPNDEAAQARLKAGNFKYRRKTPKAANGWVYSALKNVPKETRTALRTKTDLRYYAFMQKLAKKTANELRHERKDVRKAK